MTSRNYCFTLNNYEDSDLENLQNPDTLSLCSYLIYAKEVGESGTPHLQGYVVFHKPTRLSACKKFLPRAHFEVRKGSHLQALKYCQKPDTPKEDIFIHENLNKEKKVTPHAEALAADSYEEACAILMAKAPRDWLISGERMRSSLKRKFQPDIVPYVPIHDITDFKAPTYLTDWVDMIKPSRTPFLLLKGPTQLGKTAWARSLFPLHIYWKGMISLDTWNPNAKLLIFDDFEWKFMPQPKSFLTQAGEAIVTDKYRKKKTIIVNMPAIYICNEMPQWTEEEKDYFLQNCYPVTIKEKLY